MADHINRWLLVAACAYLFLLPTNAATFGISIAFGASALCAVMLYAIAWRDLRTRIPLAGPSILVPLAVWALWSCASLAWSADPAYSRGQLAREVMDSLLTMFVFYVAARDTRALRMLITAALASFAFFAVLAIGMEAVNDTWDAGRWHHGVGAWSTWVVLIAPFMFALIAPPPAGFGRGMRSLVVGFVLLSMMIGTARMTDNRIVWLGLASVFATASLVAALRWPQTFTRTPLRWVGPLAVLLLVLGLAFADVLEERAQSVQHGSVATSLERDPRIVLWEHITARIAARPWTGYGFGRRILAGPLTSEMRDPLLSHAHNVFASQWLQTGFVGVAAFAAFLLALAARYARFVRSRDDTLAFVGVVGLALLAGFVVKDVTDDFLFRSNAKELWAMTSFLLGYGVRRERQSRVRDDFREAVFTTPGDVAKVVSDPTLASGAAARAAAASPSRSRRRSGSA